MVREEIKRIVDGSDIPYSIREGVVNLFEHCFIEYYQKKKDIHFDTVELRDLWFYLKIMLLGKLAPHEDRAYSLLNRELKMNAQKFLNNKYMVQDLGRKV